MTKPRPVWYLGWALLALPLTGCLDNAPGKPDPAKKPIRPSEVTDFAKLFSQNCAGCHGKDGNGQPAPPLNDRIFLESLAPGERDPQKKARILADVIHDGRKGTLMPAFGGTEDGLTDQQINILAIGILERWGAPPDVKDVPPYLAGKTVGNADNGRILFSMACASCHGKKGEGTPAAGPLNDPAFLALISDQALRRFIITGRPDLKEKMPNFAGDAGRKSEEMPFTPLTSQQVANLTAYLATWRTTGTVAQK